MAGWPKEGEILWGNSLRQNKQHRNTEKIQEVPETYGIFLESSHPKSEINDKDC